MKKKLLFVIPGLDAGGAEKSLVNLLNRLDGSRFSVDLFLFSHDGLFISQVPEWVRILPRNADLVDFQKPLPQSLLTFLKKGKFALVQDRLLFYLKNRLIKNKGVGEQYAWQNLRNACGMLPEPYDAAIGFLEKTSVYFVVDCVKAVRKIGFIHTLYSELNIKKLFDLKYFSALQHLAAVSSECARDLISNFPSLKDRIVTMPNTVSSKLIHRLSHHQIEALSEDAVLSVGRLEKVKGFDLAVAAASVLKEKGVDFHWYIIGEGSERKYLEQMIVDRKLGKHFTLLGLKENPYPYIREAKVFVQPSRYEGKSIAIDEAKILAKPIVLTNFTTAKDQLEDHVNGLIVEMTPEAIAGHIQLLLEQPALGNLFSENLRKEECERDSDVEKFYEFLSF